MLDLNISAVKGSVSVALCLLLLVGMVPMVAIAGEFEVSSALESSPTGDTDVLIWKKPDTSKTLDMTIDFEEYSHPATREEINKMREQIGVYDLNKNYNIRYNGYGTGLAPPTEEEWERMIGNVYVVEPGSLPKMELPSSVDLSAEPYFPQVRSQGWQGSCAAWAATYYAVGYIQAKNHNWTQAGSGNNSQLLSPAFTYNKCNGGTDSGSSMYGNGRVMQTVGVSRWSEMPYNDADPVSWGSESAWRDAPEYRVKNIYALSSPYDDSEINTIKNAVASGLPVTFALNASSYDYFGQDDVLGSTAMQPSINHGNCIVGYDDSKRDVETGETGAFKVVNSWGSTWGPNGNGYYWITYQAFKGNNIWSVTWFDDLYVNDFPKLLATWKLDPQPDRDASIELGIGPHDNPLDTRSPWWDGHSMQMHPYPEFMSLDITEFYGEWESATTFYLDVGDAAGSDGVITSFKVEYYEDDYTPGLPDAVSPESPDTPKTTPGYVFCVLDATPPDPPTLESPPDGETINDATPTFTWTPVEDPSPPVTYTLQYSTSFQPVTDGLVSWWSFDDGTAKDVWGTNHGTIYGATPTAGMVGQALSFDGNDRVDVPHSSSLALTNNFTVETWVKRNVNQFAGIINKFNTYQPGWQYYGWSVLSGSNGEFGILLGRGQSAWTYLWTNSAYSLDWHHVVFVRSSGVSSIYVDGVLASGTTTSEIIESGQKMAIGNLYALYDWDPAGSDYFKGLIDEVRIYNRALSEDEIKQIYRGTAGVTRTIEGVLDDYYEVPDDDALPDGTYYWRVRAVDGAGNKSEWSGTWEFTVSSEDITPPTSSVDPIDPYWRNKVPFTITATASDDLSGVVSVELFYRYSADGFAWGDWVSFGADADGSDGWSWAFTGKNGYYEFYSRATDGAGNIELVPEEADARCGVDRTKPGIKRPKPAPGSTVSPGKIKISVKIIDKLSGVDPSTITMSINGKQVEPRIKPIRGGYKVSCKKTFGDGATVEVEVRVKDFAGNLRKKAWTFYVSST